MNTKTLKTLTVAMALAGGIGVSAPAMAISQSLPGAANVKDVWVFSCPAGFGARARVNDTANPNTATDIRVGLSHDGNPIRTATDFTDNNVPTAYTAVIPESGAYVMYVTRVGGTAAEIYRGDVICVNAVGGIFHPLVPLVFDDLL